MRWLVGVLLSASIAAGPVVAQHTSQQTAASSPGALIRVLDKINGDTTDIEIGRGEARNFGNLTIVLGDCRYPPKNPNSDAWAWLEIRDQSMNEPAFSGWMVASSPALNAMDHARYDVWLMRCSNN